MNDTSMQTRTFSTRAVLFDFDGTLTKPGAIDFAAIKQCIGCPVDMAVLEFLDTLTDVGQKQAALQHLERAETLAAERSEPNAHAEDIVVAARQSGLPVGIITRNSLSSVLAGLKNFSRIDRSDFDVIISRDDPVDPKPSPQGVLAAAEHLDMDPGEILVVGDFDFDIRAGNAAGAGTVYLTNGDAPPPAGLTCDHVIPDLSHLRPILRLRRPLAAGKLPNDMLADFLEDFFQEDPTVLVRPGIGEDTAAVDVTGTDVVVLKSDPITFATDAIGHYAVCVNANDIATAGATPRWFLTTLLFPPGSTGAYIRHVMRELKTVCNRWGITLCGGHTEITDAVRRPVVSGMLAGVVAKDRLMDKKRMDEGDRVLLTKGVAVEGTAIIAREFAEKLEALGMAGSAVEKAKSFLSDISILEEARAAGGPDAVSAMHDVTEGGLATALDELSIAGGHRLEIDMDRIPVFSETAEICRIMRLDPLGLIGSGSLLICARQTEADRVMARISERGIRVTCIGRVAAQGTGVTALKNARPAVWPTFDVDEIARLFNT